MLKDHLGNVRMVLTEEVQTKSFPPASMETAEEANESQYYTNINSTIRSTKPANYPADTYTSPNAYAAKLNGQAGTTKIGPAIILKVMAGDKFNLRVNSWWSYGSGGSLTAPNPLTELAQALAGGIAGLSGGKVSAIDLNSSGLTGTAATSFLTNQNGAITTRPRAFVNWVLLDENFNIAKDSAGNYIRDGYSNFQQVGDADVFTTHSQVNAPINKNGYLYIYVSNQSPNMDVYFDNLQVTHIKGPILEETHYYPFGLTMAGISSTASNNTFKNRYGFGSKEIQEREFYDNSGIDLNDFGARYFDFQLGRWHSVDPHCNNYLMFSPYVYVGNSPILLVDPDGKDWFYHSKDGKGDPEWVWHEGSEYNTGVKDEKGNEVILKGVEAAVVFMGSRDEKLGQKNGKNGYLDGQGSVTADVIVYGPKGPDDIHKFRGFTVGSDPVNFGAIDEGMYEGNYDVLGKSGTLKSNWAVNHRGPVRMMDGDRNPFVPSQIDKEGDGYKTGIFIHTSNQNGYAGTIKNGKSGISVGCLLIFPKDWKSFNNVMLGVKSYRVQIIRAVNVSKPPTGYLYPIPGEPTQQTYMKHD
jgi:RHS repeat-associated protein